MGTITVNIDDNTEQFFRKTVKESYGEGKGKLGKAIGEALKNWADNKTQQKAKKRMLELLKKGFYQLPNNYKFNREEIYDRF